MDWYNEDEIKALDRRFCNEDFGGASFTIFKGSSNIIVSAPHSVRHWREGSARPAESLTGVIVHLLHRKLDCFGIAKTKDNHDDANYDRVHPYKDAIVSLVAEYGIRYLFDLHIMNDSHRALVELGTGGGANIGDASWLPSLISGVFQKHGASEVVIDQYFSAADPGTVSAFIAQTSKISCVQLEINWRLLNPDSPQRRFRETVETLFEILTAVSKRNVHAEA